MQCLEYPPDGFHVVGIHGAVPVLPVNPTPHPVDGVLPLLGIAKHNGAALLVEIGNSVLLDGDRTADTQGLLHFKLNWKTVAIPPEPSVHTLSFHGLVTGNGIL